jgi:hypothetical protein
MMTQQPDRIRQYLRRRGCAPSIVKGGLDGLLEHWDSLVQAVEEGYDLTFDDYLNDMDLRDILEGALEVASQDERKKAEDRLPALDERFRNLTIECAPIWGEKVARENGHDPAEHWWYFRRPRTPAPDFEEELREAGLIA